MRNHYKAKHAHAVEPHKCRYEHNDESKNSHRKSHVERRGGKTGNTCERDSDDYGWSNNACLHRCLPNYQPPIIDTVCPIGLGIRTPASRIISNVTSSRSISIKVGKGTFSLWEARLINSGVGIIS